MLTIATAHRWIGARLGHSSRGRHSVFVGYAMRQLAGHLGVDELVWELTGLCHDLDFNAVADDWSRHGLLAAEWLAGELPEEALLAIRAHDHRTGVQCQSPLCRGLKLCDALAIIVPALGPDTAPILRPAEAVSMLSTRLADRAYLPGLLIDNAAALGVRLSLLADVVATAPAAD